MILFFDPGPSTGIAVIDGDRIVDTTVVRNLTDDEFASVARTYAQSYPDARVAIEAPPAWSGNMRPITSAYEQILRTIFPDAEWIQPGQWKNTPSARTKVPEGLTQHERDAVRAGRWLQAKERSSARTRSA